MSVKKDTIFCMFCKKTVPTTDFNNHEKSDEHQNVIKAKLGDITVGCMMCKACMVPVNSEVIWNSHSKGRNHKKQVNFLHKVGKLEKFDRPFSLLEFDKSSSDPITDQMFSVVPDLFAPIVEVIKLNSTVSNKETDNKQQVDPAAHTDILSEPATATISNDKTANENKDRKVENNSPDVDSNRIADSGDTGYSYENNANSMRKKRSSRFDRRADQQQDMILQEDRNVPERRRRGFGHQRAGENRHRERCGPNINSQRGQGFTEREQFLQKKENQNFDSPVDIKKKRKRKSKWDDTEKVSKSDYNKIADEFLSSSSKPVSTTTSEAGGTSSGAGSIPLSAPSTLPPFPPPPLFPPPGAMFPNIDPYAGIPPPFNPPPLMGMPPMQRMPFPPPPPHMLPLPPAGLPMPPSSLPMPLLPPTSIAMPTSIPISHPLPPPAALPETLQVGSDSENKSTMIDDSAEDEETEDRSHIDNTPKPSIPFFIESSEVEIFIPDFFADRYPEHPHRGAVKADPEIALFETIEKEKRSKEPIPVSIHSRMTTKPILVVNEELKPFNPDDYESLKGQVLPIIKPNQKFVVIGSNCLKVTGPNHFVCDLCKVKFNDADKMEHLLSKSHLLNILWNWDPDSAQMIKDIERLNKNLFDKKVMEAANEIQKKEIKLLSEHQLRIRARILDENVNEQNKHFIKNDVFDPANFPNHDFSFLNKEKVEESDDEEILSSDPNKPNKMKILEAGIINMLKSADPSDIVSDEDTALAALGICKNLMKKMEDRFQKCKHIPSEDTLEKLKKVKHFFNNLLIIQQILDVYPSTASKDKPSSNSSKKRSDRTGDVLQAAEFSQPAAFAQPAAFSQAKGDSTLGPYSGYTSMSGFPSNNLGIINPAMYSNIPNPSPVLLSKAPASDPRKSKQADTGYSLYSSSVDQAGIEWYRKNKVT